MTAVIRMEVGRVPMPRAPVAEADVHATRTIVAGNKPPNVGVEIPTRVHEHVADTLDDAVTVDPDIVAVTVGPVTIDPDPARADGDRLLDHDRFRRRRSLLGDCERLGLLNHDDGFALDLLTGAVLGFDDDVGRRVGRFGRLLLAHVPVVRDIDLVPGIRAVTIGPFVIGLRGNGDRQRERQSQKRRESNELGHDFSFGCKPVVLIRHPPDTERARPPRQKAQKVLGFLRLE